MQGLQKGSPDRWDRKKLFIFDMDGTIYLGGRVFPPAIRLIRQLRADGKRVLFFTNNASHNPAFYVEKLTHMGFEPREGELMTSGDVTISFLKRHRSGQSVYLVGTPELETQFKQSGIALSEEAKIVVSSFDTTLTYEKLRIACDRIREGAEYFCTHPDLNCPTETGFIPDSGAIASFLTAATGVRPTYFGKPYAQTVEMIGEVTGMAKEEMCIFGDRLYTDIALGRQNGVCSILVLSGETSAEGAQNAAEADRPDWIYQDLAEAYADYEIQKNTL